MKKIYETIFGLLSSLIIFLSPAEGKKITHVNNDYHIPDIPKISSLDEIELIQKPGPLILKQADFDTDNIFAGHRSHASHRSHSSHVSHRSHASHYSGSSSPSSMPPEERTPKETIIPTERSRPSKPISDSPATRSLKEWQTSAEWISNPCMLHQREVVIYLKDDTRYQGMVTGCQNDSIQISREIPGSGEMKQWMNLKEIKALLWR